MNSPDTDRACPQFPALVRWFDDLLDQREETLVDEHLEGCARCRRLLVEWSEPVSADPPSHGCIDEESLVAYAVAPAALGEAAVISIERHLRECARCTGALQGAMHAQRRLEDRPAESVAAGEPLVAAPPRPMIARADRASRWLDSLRARFTPALFPTAAVAAAALAVALGVSRFMVRPADIAPDQVRDASGGAMVELSTDIAGYARPAVDEPVVVQLVRGTRGRRLESTDQWTRIELADGRRVWVPSRSLTTAQDN